MCATTEIAGMFQCVCVIGEMCMGTCAGKQTVVQAASQTCQGNECIHTYPEKSILYQKYEVFMQWLLIMCSIALGCTDGTYGYNCMETCNCMNGGTCDRQTGCVCVEGEWTGTECSIGKCVYILLHPCIQ